MEKQELILSQLASSQGRRDEVPNVELGQSIAATGDTRAIAILTQNLSHKKKEIRRDCIKALYEAGNINPSLLKPHLPELLPLTHSKDNRMQWGGMTALECIAREEAEALLPHLPFLMKAALAGSVITRDHFVKILVHVGKQNSREIAFEMLHEILLSAPINQLPSYAEEMLPLITGDNRNRFRETLESRISELEDSPAKHRRMLKAIKKASS